MDTTTIERSVLRLEDWLVRFGQVWNGVDGEETAATEVVKQQYDGNADDYGLFVVDIWTDVCPMSRGLEYELHVDNYFVHGKKADDKDIIVIDHDDGSKHDGKGAKFTKKGKGRAHPNTKSKMKQQQEVKITNNDNNNIDSSRLRHDK